jgi:hypothetical protein
MAGILVKVKGDGAAVTAAAKSAFGAVPISIEPILRVPPTAVAAGVAPGRESTWLHVAGPTAARNPWDEAHETLAMAFAAGAPEIEVVEPNLDQQWVWRPKDTDRAGNEFGIAAASAADFCAFENQTTEGGRARGPGPVWNLGDAFSQLKKARERVGARQALIRIAHLDTGYDPAHATKPERLLTELQRNFVDRDHPDDAVDRVPPGMELIRNRGHGTGTLSLLAGNMVAADTPGLDGFHDFLGGAPGAGIIAIRIADWVARLTTSTMVEGIEYARAKGAHVLSMSMGGMASDALADAVNLAYQAGMVLVTAAGNNFAWVPSPKSVVYPARFRRVLAACGVMADGRAYAGLAAGTMQGNYGPAEKMATALGAYTPNVPWAQIDCGKIVDMDGGGTSAATPQIAAAAALWLAEHWDTVKTYPEPWMRVEAVREALSGSASKWTPRMNQAETKEKIGQGVLRAFDALALQPLPAAKLKDRMQPPADGTWPWLHLIFGGGVSFGAGLAGDERRRRMLALELTQMAQRVPEVDAAIAAPEADPATITAAARNRYLAAALDAGNPSKPLRAFLEGLLGRQAAVPVLAPDGAPIRRKLVEPEPPPRRLRVYALDPSTARRLATIAVNEATIAVPWDDAPVTREPLRPGPVGEYLEVIDVDPASGKAYDPIDLNDRILLARQGLDPSEGNPKFHQQMVYAVAMDTIGHFEAALGRKALWAPRRAYDAEGNPHFYEVPRLRIYPHALRTANAYYSPEKVALLFGYFPAAAASGSSSAPGNMVFTCLSNDIISHEMSHALLDGLHRRFQERSNPDVAAFHEAFADIVAVFRHFTIRELVRFEIGRAHGELSAAGLLSGLAAQFGEGSGIGGALRDYRPDKVASKRYSETFEPHDRAEILVMAVYAAFLAIVRQRTEDLVRIATGGTGIVPDGALHPDLVDRLTNETCKSATHVLRICIRALDYCPPVDITFGEYLRALITADIDLVPEDARGYRTAFIEAFREWGIPVRDVRTLSPEALTWNAPENDQPDWLKTVFRRVDFGFGRKLERSDIFMLNERNRWRVWEALKTAFAKDPDLCRQFGLMPGVARFNRDGSTFREARAGETTFDVFSVRPARRLAPDGSFRVDIVAAVGQRRAIPLDGENISNGFFWFRGGATLVLDANEGNERIRYSIIKSAGSRQRIEIQRRMELGGPGSPARAMYFGAADQEPFAMMHADRRGDVDG